MKYKPDKLDRKQVILECCKAHPDCSLEEIGKVFGVSKQYVSELVLKDKWEKATRVSFTAEDIIKV